MEVKGSAKRLITTPGYHIKPQYDLEGLRKKMESSSGREFDVVLPLTSMIDMFSMLVIFLLLNFSATGEAYFVNKDIVLPEAAHARPIESLPLVSITPEGIYLDSNAEDARPVKVDLEDEYMLPLVNELNRLKSIQANFEAAGLKPKKQINLQADMNTDVKYIKRVMNILINNDITGINFAVREVPPDKQVQ